jgi:hypothetical protein
VLSLTKRKEVRHAGPVRSDTLLNILSHVSSPAEEAEEWGTPMRESAQSSIILFAMRVFT